MFFLPIGDTPNPQNYTPWVNWALIAANVAVYVLISLPQTYLPVAPDDPLLRQYLDVFAAALPPGLSLDQLAASLSSYELFVFEHGYKPAAPSLIDLFTALFLHGGFGHLAGNMLFLWIYGDNVEHRLGHVPYLLAYLATGALATLSYSLFAMDSMAPLVGASGAISGVLGFYFYFFPRNQVKIFFAFFVFVFRVFLVPSRIVLGLYVVWDNLLPFLAGSGGSVAYGAHLGGFFAGLGLAWLVERRSHGGHNNEAEALLEIGLERLQQGQVSSAYHYLTAALERDPDPETEARIRQALAQIFLYRPQR
jgi:membrane associated rhomboid family serine protease